VLLRRRAEQDDDMTAIRVSHAGGGTVTGFRAWRRGRPLVGGVLLVLSGVEMFFSGQLDLGNIHIQLGFEGFQATVIPALMAVLGILAVITPAQRMFYGIFALILAVYSLVGVNLGGFLLGMLLGAVGGVLVVAWRPKVAGAEAPEAAQSVASDAPPAEPMVSETAGEPTARAQRGGVHAEAVDYATLKSLAESRRRGAGSSSPKRAPAEPRPFVRGRS
jgi:hypothetical protein